MKPTKEMVTAALAVYEGRRATLRPDQLMEAIYLIMRDVEFEQEKLELVESISRKMLGH